MPRTTACATKSASHRRRQLRRNRPGDDKTLDQAKTAFAATVTRRTTELMDEHGYSRDRAVGALLHEIVSCTSKAAGSHPSDDEIFRAMRQHGLGMEQAARALAVSSSIDHLVSADGFSTVQAVEHLTSKLARANLGKSMTSVVSAPPSPRSETTASPPKLMKILPLSLPAAAPRQGNSAAAAPTKFVLPKKTKSAAAKNGKTAKSKEASSCVVVACKSANRKRSADETTDHAKGVAAGDATSRARSDSIADAVSAKFAKQPAPENNSLPPTTAVRGAKRGREETVDQNSTPAKRARSTSSA